MRKLLPTLALALTCFTAVFAQDKEKAGGVEGIFIKQNNNKDTKFTVEIKDGVVLINGEKVEGRKELGDVTVFEHRQLKHEPHVYNLNNLTNGLKPGPVMLGVLTEKKEAAGATVKVVAPNSAAEKAGLKTGDVITQIDADKIAEPQEVFEKIGKHEPGDQVTITYLRDGKQNTATVKLEERKGMGARRGMPMMAPQGGWNGAYGRGYSPDGFSGGRGHGGYGGGYNRGGFGNGYGHGGFYGRGFHGGYGHHHHFHGDSTRPKLGLSAQDTQDSSGVQVLSVKAGSAAEKAGFKQGDVITAIAGKPVKSTRGLMMQYFMNKKKDTVTAEVKRGGQTKTLEITVPKQLHKVEL